MAIATLVFSVWSRKYGIEAVHRWAAAEGFQVLRVRRRSLVPHWRLESSKGFQFFEVTVRRGNGSSRKAWMKLESDTNVPRVVEVKWDDEKP